MGKGELLTVGASAQGDLDGQRNISSHTACFVGCTDIKAATYCQSPHSLNRCKAIEIFICYPSKLFLMVQ